MTDTVPSDYDDADGWSDEHNCECCPHCEEPWSMNGGMQGPAVDSRGVEKELYIEIDPSNGPIFCKDCWEELDTNRKQQNHATLGEFKNE